MERRHTRVSYVKKPLAKRSFMSAVLVAAGLCLFLTGMYISIKNQGQAPLNVAAMQFDSQFGGSLVRRDLIFGEREKLYSG